MKHVVLLLLSVLLASAAPPGARRPHSRVRPHHRRRARMLDQYLLRLRREPEALLAQGEIPTCGP